MQALWRRGPAAFLLGMSEQDPDRAATKRDACRPTGLPGVEERRNVGERDISMKIPRGGP